MALRVTSGLSWQAGSVRINYGALETNGLSRYFISLLLCSALLRSTPLYSTLPYSVPLFLNNAISLGSATPLFVYLLFYYSFTPLPHQFTTIQPSYSLSYDYFTLRLHYSITYYDTHPLRLCTLTLSR